MSRSALLFAIMLVGGCRTAADAEQVGSPSGSVAGTEAAVETTKSRSPSALTSSGSKLGNSLIAVTTVSASDVQPCERVCGSLGDCLIGNPDYNATIAGGLELECLDMCVHSPDDNRAKTDFLACGGKTQCGELEACAEQTWTALAKTRKSPDVSGIVAASDPCKAGCRWYYSCVYGNGPPGQAYLTAADEGDMNSCMDACDSDSGIDRDVLSMYAECLPTHCSMEGMTVCWEQHYSYNF